MPIPSNRYKLLPLRGPKADLVEGLADILEGEMCYAIDEDRYYQKEGGVLVAVGGGSGGGGGFSGDYNDLTNKPDIPDATSDLTNDSGFITAAEAPVQPGDVFSGDYNDLTNKPTIPPAYDDTALEGRVATNESDIAQLQTDVGNIDSFSGDYNDLTNKPAIPANTSDLVNDSGFIIAAEAPVQPGDLDSKADLVNGVVPNSQLPSIAITEYLGEAANESAMLALDGQKGDWCIRIDTSSTWVVTGEDSSQVGSWTELATPASAVTSVNGYTGTVVLSASDVGALASGDNVSELTNNAGYITAAEAPVQPGDVFSGDYNDLTNKPDIPNMDLSTLDPLP